MKNIYFRLRSTYEIVWSFGGLWRAFIGMFTKIPRQADLLIICHDVHRHSKKNDLLYAPLTDPFFEEFNSEFKCVTLAAPFSKHDGKRCFGYVRNCNFGLIFALFRRFLLTQTNQLGEDPVEKFYIRLLKKISPSVIIGIQPSIELCIAARELGIRIFDMQHGVISNINYYNVGKRQHIGQNGWPDAVLCWDHESASRVQRISENNCATIVVGNPSYHSRHSLQAPKLCEDLNRDKAVGRRSYLITLTYMDFGVSHPDECYRQIGVPNALLKLVRDQGDIDWKFRLHPVQYRFHYNRVIGYLRSVLPDNENVDWDSCSGVPFGEAIRGCHGHITVASASALDAAQNGLQTLLVGCGQQGDKALAYEYFKEYIDSGVVHFVDGPDLKAEHLKLFQDGSEVSQNQCPELRKSKSQNLMNEFIEQLRLDLKDVTRAP